MREQAETIKALQDQLHHATVALTDSQHTQDELNSLIQQLTPSRRETPGPHRLQPKGQRQEDLEHQEKIRQQEDVNVASTNTSNPDQFSPIEHPTNRPINELTCAKIVRREFLWTRIRKRFARKQKKRKDNIEFD
jgi:hypothetical protein